ncbi:MAG: prepilin-type N-terminal cleavage/methylation domain-containing protein [Candidatus Eisenbacteria bacterium]|nr:prepilin-type N-terminal cleavage/methylation domain-containing protein [Candidatus Eisenbacteria bacterium]
MKPMPEPGGRSRAQAGFTLVELMVALTILAIGILSIGQIFAVSARHAIHGKTETTAVALAREIEEKILSESVDQVKTMFDEVDTSVPASITTPCEEWAAHVSTYLGGVGGRGRIQVMDSTEDPGLIPGMMGVRIQIQWLERGDTLVVPLEFATTSVGS